MAERGVRISMELIRRIFEYLWGGEYKLENFTKSETEKTVIYREEARLIVRAKKDSSGMPIIWSIHSLFYSVHGHEDGTVEVESGLTNIQEYITRATHLLYKKKFKEAEKNGDKEGWNKLLKEWREKCDEIQRDLAERRNIDKYMTDERLKNLVLHVKYADEVARRVSEKYGTEVIHYIYPPPEEYDLFRSIFNAKGMSEDQIFEEVKKRIDAVKEAYDPFSPFYHLSSRNLEKIHKRLYGGPHKKRR